MARPSRWNVVEAYRKGTNWHYIPFNLAYFKMWGFVETICFDCLIVLLELKPTGISLTTDCSVGKGLVVWFRTGVLWVKFNAETRLYPLPPPPLEFASLFWFLCLFSRLNQKSVRKENSSRGWVVYILTSYFRLMTICLLWISWNTCIIFFCKKMTYFSQGDRF